MPTNLIHDAKMPFCMDSDVERLVRADYGFLGVTDSFEDYLRENAFSYGALANLWSMIVRHKCGDHAADCVEGLIRYSLSNAIKVCDSAADALRRSEPVEKWISDAAELHGTANVIAAMSFGKRFSPVCKNNALLNEPFVDFKSLQMELRKRGHGKFVSLDGGPAGYSSLIALIFFFVHMHLEEIIGEGPNDMDYDQYYTSSGSSLTEEGVKTYKCPAEKIVRLIKAKHSVNAQDDFNLNVTNSWYTWDRTEVVYVVEYRNPMFTYFERNWFSTAPEVIIPDAMVNWNAPSITDDDTISHFYRSSSSRWVFGEGPQWERGQKWTVSACSYTQPQMFMPVITGWTGRFRKVTHFKATTGNYIKFTSVPKNFEKKRGIGVETACRMSDQLRVKTALEKALARTWVTRTWANLRDQSQNRALARTGAVFAEFGTTDISSASDWISLFIASQCFPGGWYRVFVQTRPTHYTDGKGSANVMYTLAPMGCGWTFHMETAFYLALALTAFDIAVLFGEKIDVQSCPDCFKRLKKYSLYQEKLHGITVRAIDGTPYYVSVYGDDVIIPVEVVPYYMAICEKLGIKVNEKKTFSTGTRFRESCGGDFYRNPDGTVDDATPIYWPRTQITCFEYSDGQYKFTKDSTTRDWKGGEVVKTTQLTKLVMLQHALWDYCPEASHFLLHIVKNLVPGMTASSAYTICNDLWAAADMPIPGIFDITTGKVRPLRKGESYPVFTDPLSGETVEMWKRELHLGPTSTYPTRYEDTAELTAEQLESYKQLIWEYLLDQFLRHGGRYICDTCIGNGMDIPILQPVSLESLMNEPEIVWTLHNT